MISNRKYVLPLVAALTLGLISLLPGCKSGNRPQVVSIYPTADATGVPLDASIEIAFDRPVRFSSATSPVTLTLDGKKIEGMASIGEGGGYSKAVR